MDVMSKELMDNCYSDINAMAYYRGILDYIHEDMDRQKIFRNEMTFYINKISYHSSVIHDKIEECKYNKNITQDTKDTIRKLQTYSFDELKKIPKYREGFEFEKKREEKFFKKYHSMNNKQKQKVTDTMTRITMLLKNYN